MKNKDLEYELGIITNYANKRIKIIDFGIEYWLFINDNCFLYYSLSDLVLDCIEISRLFELEFV